MTRGTTRKPKARAADDRPRYGALRTTYLGERLRALGLTAHALEERLRTEYGVRVNVYRLLDGRRPSLDTLTALALVLECGLDDLWWLSAAGKVQRAAAVAQEDA